MILSALLTTVLLCQAPNTTVFYDAAGILHVVGDAGRNGVAMDDEGGTPRIRVGFGQTLNGVPGPTSAWLTNAPRLIVDLGDGNDTMHYKLPLFANRIFDLGSGNDFIDIGNVGAAHTEVHAGDGDDHVHTEDCSYHSLFVDLGAGADDFEVAWCYIDRWFEAHAGAGPDEVRLRRTLFLGPVHAYGGTGVDSFMDIESDYFDIAKFGEFESRSPSELGLGARWTPLDPIRKAERLVAGAIRLFHGRPRPLGRLPDAPPSRGGLASPR